MPFTLSHPAAALVLRRTGLPVPAVVGGTMAPDLPLFLHSPAGYRLTHSVLGIVTVDVLIGLTGLAGWLLVLRDALVDTAPRVVRERVPAHVPYPGRQWLLSVPAVAVGALTHVAWDEFTHEGRWGARHIAWLRESHGGRAGYHLAQAGSGVLGLAVVLAWIAVTVRRRPRTPRGPLVPALTGWAPCAVLVVAGVATVVTMTRLAGGGLHAMVLAAAVRGLGTFGVAFVVAALVWQVLERRGEA